MSAMTRTRLRGRKPARIRGGKAVRSALLVLLSLILAFSCCGCRKSTVLTERVPDQENGVVDQTEEPLYNEVEGAPEDPTRISTLKSENDNINDQDEVKATYSKAPNTSSKSKKRQQQESDKDQESTEGNLDGDAENPTGGEVEGDGSSVADGTGEGEGDGTGEGDDSAPTPGGAGGTGVASGGQENEPLVENVKTVAATGQVALAVQMLCGKGALAAADESWLSKVRATDAFSGEGLEDVAVCWSGDGQAAGSMSVSEILAVKPDCVLLDSAQTAQLSEADKNTLLENSVSIQSIPFALGSVDTPDADIVRAVEMIGELMHSSYTAGVSQLDSSSVAEKYVEFHDNLIDAYVNANGGYSYLVSGGASYGYIYQGESDAGTQTTNLSGSRITTAFVNSWVSLGTSSVSSQRTYGEARMGYLSGAENMLDCSDGIGLSASGATRNFMLIDYYLQCTGVVDNAYEGARPAYASDGTSRPYTVIPGSFRELAGAATVMQRSKPSALWYSETGEASSSISWKTVGDASFPGVIVRDEEIAQRILASASKANGLYNVGQPYRVCVVPSGLAGSWADGTIESFLSVAWANAALRGGDAGAGESNVTNFYSTFYRCATPSAALSCFYGGSGTFVAGS